jgi:hypothetical protein
MADRWDLFISYASEDRETVAEPLAEILRNGGARVWLDQQELRLGDSLTEKIDHGLMHSTYGVVVLSPAFFAKHWPRRELSGLRAREEDGRKVILPIWHHVDRMAVLEFSSALADLLAADTSAGLPHAADVILDVVFGGAGRARPALVRDHPANRNVTGRDSAAAEEQRAVMPPGPSGASAMPPMPTRVEILTDSKILSAIKREAVASLKVTPWGPDLAPNHYVVYVSPEEFQRLELRAGVLVRALAKSVTKFIGERGYRVNDKILIEVEPSLQATSGCQVTADFETAQSRRIVPPGPVSQVRRIKLRLGGHPDGLYAIKAETEVQPVDILSAMQREAHSLKNALSGGRILVPNRYLVHLSTRDHTRLAPLRSVLAQELAVSQAEFIADQVWTVYGDVIVEIRRAGVLDAGMFRVIAEVYTGGTA